MEVANGAYETWRPRRRRRDRPHLQRRHRGYRPSEHYAGIAEFSVYVNRHARGRGAGRLAMEALLEEAEKAGFWKFVSRLFPENAASRKLLGSLGFREIAPTRSTPDSTGPGSISPLTARLGSTYTLRPLWPSLVGEAPRPGLQRSGQGLVAGPRFC